MSTLQVFYWGQLSHVDNQRQYYKSFSLNGTNYHINDSVCLYPECEDLPPYIGRIVSAFTDLTTDASDPHCIEIQWYERTTNLEPGCKVDHEKEKELVELEEKDVNPIGCISRKCTILRASSYAQAVKLAKGVEGEWFYCKGIFKQECNGLVTYKEFAATAEQGDANKKAGRRQMVVSAEDMADSDEIRTKPESKRLRLDTGRAIAPVEQHTRLNIEGMVPLDCLQAEAEQPDRVGRRKAGGASTAGKVCLECGATQTPQWREGPNGPKTLCNACGVRFVRAQARANKRAAAGLPSRPGQAVPPARGGHGGRGRGRACEKVCVTPALPRMSEHHTSRPMRQAAVLAATRTAEFARTGIFPLGDDTQRTYQATQQDRVARRQGTSHDSSNNSTDSADEVVYEPAAAGTAVPPLRLPKLELGASKLPSAAPQGMTAAASLLAFANDEDTDGMAVMDAIRAAEDAMQCVLPGTIDDQLMQDLRQVASKASGFLPEMSELQGILAHFADVKDQLPRDVVAKLDSVSDMVAKATGEAQHAEAAALAVQQVLLAKQEAARQARETASHAIGKMKTFMSDLLSQYPLLLDHSSLLISDPDNVMGDNTLIQLDPAGELISVRE